MFVASSLTSCPERGSKKERTGWDEAEEEE
jgi:hypothetical protein